MKQEIEVRFLDINHDDMRSKLAAAGAVCEHPMRLMRRAIIDYPDRQAKVVGRGGWSWVRIRDEGNKITCTYKHIADDGKNTTHEIEYEVSSYEKAIELFEAIGLMKYSEQQSKRETWQLGGVEIVLDIWPWAPPYIEVEGESEAAIRQAAESLGLDWGNIFAGSTDELYRKYYPKMGAEEGVAEVEHLTFDGDMPQWLRDRQ